jgi:hypothetical protein
MTPDELIAALVAIGWSGRELALRLGCHRNLPVEWTSGRRAVPEPVATWLRGLVAHHAAHPAPEWRTRTG